MQILSSLDQTVNSKEAQSTDISQEQEVQERLRVGIYELAISILGVAIHQHEKNSAAFQRTVGWRSFAFVLKISTIFQTSPERFFAALLGLALGNVSSNLGRLSTFPEEETEIDSEGAAKRTAKQWTGTVEHPGALRTVLILLSELQVPTFLHLSVLAILENMATSNKRNKAQMANARLASLLLKEHNQDEPPAIERSRLRILESLYQLGIPSQDCRVILRKVDADNSSPYLGLLQTIARSSALPNLITFDMSRYAHCSVAMSSLPRPFPPGPSSRGFSFFAPILIEKIEPSMVLDLLHLFDSQRTCSVKLTIEPGTGQLRYSTSRDSQPIHFHHSRILPGRLHHICLIHTRPSGGSKRSLVQLYIDGHFTQEEKAPWPTTPPLSSNMRAVFGTPPLERLPKETNRLVWSLGPAYLLDDILPPEMPLVIAELASTGYNGNFQDSLGRFLTYSISTRINLRLENLARANGSNDAQLNHHPLVEVITESARNIFKEDRFYFVFNSANHYDLEKISKRATSTTQSSSSVDRSQKPGNQLLLNQAVTLTKDAIETSYGYAKLFGEPVLAPTQSLADTIWKLGGCAILLRIIERCNNSKDLEQSLAFTFELLQTSWRLSEDVERSKGYEILNYLVSQKKHLITPAIFELFCIAVGCSYTQANDAALVNPFLYRIILLDFHLWSQTTAQVRLAHLEQFVTLLKTSKHRKFNAKRMAKMQISKKLLQMLQLSDGLLDDTEEAQKIIDKALSALRISLISSFNDGAIRSISTYLTSQLCSSLEGGQSLSSSSSGSSSSSQRRHPPPPPPRRQQTLAEGTTILSIPPSSLSQQQTRQAFSLRTETALRIFEMLTDLVLERPAFLLKLGSAVNIKWLLIFFGPSSEKRAASLALDIMTALLVRDKRYVDRLARSGGVKVIERLLPRFWNYPRIISRCWSILFDIDEQPGNTSLYTQFKPREQQRIVCPLMLRFIVACLGAGFQNIKGVKPKKEILRSRPSDLLDVPAKANDTHGRRRSRSMNVDVTILVQEFQISNELILLKDTVRLLEEHAQNSIDFCELLFTQPLLRSSVAIMTPYVELSDGEGDCGQLTETSQLANRLLNVWATSAVESITTSGSTQIVTAMVEAIPPDSDLSTATKFRLALYDRIASAVENIIIPGLGDVLDDAVRTAISDFIEQCSGEVQNSKTMTLTAKVLASFSTTRPSNSIIAALLTSLDRIILFRLAAGSLETYHEIIEHQEVIFMDANQDIAFFQCLLHNVISVIQQKVGVNELQKEESMRIACYNVLILLARARPAMVESIIVPEKTLQDFRKEADIDLASKLLMGNGQDQVPFSAEWQGFKKSRDSLKAAVHLDRMSRVSQLLLSTDEKQKAILSTEKKMMIWQNSVRVNEESRLLKIRLDAMEMMNFGAGEWIKMLAELQRERAVFGKDGDTDRVFELDPTEGPMRMRPKLKEMPRTKLDQQQMNQLQVAESSWMPPSHGDEWASGDGSLELEGETAPMVETTIPRIEETAPSAASRDEGVALDTHDDKYRRVIRSLEKGDVIEGVENSLRVMFIECRASLLVFGKKCLYIIDDYFQRPDGELCNLWEAPEEERDTVVMSTLDGEGKGRQSLIEQLEGNAQQTRKWSWSEVKFIAIKTFLHRKTAVEIHFKDGQSCLLVLATVEKADNVYLNLATRNKGAAQAFASLNDSLREANNSEASGFSRFAGAVLGKSVGSITQRWIDRKMSNFDYLMCLNTAAGRTYQDITQYPVMPWVLRDYTSETLDLNNPDSFRNLELPMGAQLESRRKQFEDRYKQLQELEDMDPDATKPFHYGTHYSTAATVSGYLIRLRPFDKILKVLQGGTFDLADRTFGSIGHAFHSASEGSLGDVRELIPEAYYLPEFLINSNKFEFGTTQSGTVVDDVELPAWANGDPLLFIKLHREALESDYVSMHLHSWIDLIFGFKQRGEAAVEATNCFHELSYDDGLDLQSLDSTMEQQAVLKTIHMFGVCPRKLFNHPHPKRKPVITDDNLLCLHQSEALLTQSIAPCRILHASVHFIYASNPHRAFASPKDYIILPHLSLSLSVGHLDGSIRFFAKENMNSVRNVVEQVMPDRISAITDASSDIDPQEGKILVGGLDGSLTAWSVNGARRNLNFLYSCRGHVDVILCLEYCQVWNMAVSGSQDGTAIIWDSRGKYFKTLVHDGPVQTVSVSQTNGLIATASGPTLRLWSINGNLIASVSTNAKEPVISLAFLEEEDGKDLNQEKKNLTTLFTGHRGKVITWKCRPNFLQIGNTKWILEPRHVLEHHDRIAATTTTTTTPLITAIKSKQNMIITGDEIGRLFVWALPGKGIDLPHNISNTCMQCEKKFGVFEKRINCAACGGLFCNACTDNLGQPFSTFR